MHSNRAQKKGKGPVQDQAASQQAPEALGNTNEDLSQSETTDSQQNAMADLTGQEAAGNEGENTNGAGARPKDRENALGANANTARLDADRGQDSDEEDFVDAQHNLAAMTERERQRLEREERLRRRNRSRERPQERGYQVEPNEQQDRQEEVHLPNRHMGNAQATEQDKLDQFNRQYPYGLANDRNMNRSRPEHDQRLTVLADVLSNMDIGDDQYQQIMNMVKHGSQKGASVTPNPQQDRVDDGWSRIRQAYPDPTRAPADRSPIGYHNHYPVADYTHGPQVDENPPKKEKVQFEAFTAKFSGAPSESVAEFVRLLDRQKVMAQASDRVMGQVLTRQLSGVALSWFNLLPDNMLTNWSLLKGTLLAKYDTLYGRREVRSACRNRYKRRDETVNQYAAEMLTNMVAAGYDEENQIETFMEGLPEYMRGYVSKQEPGSMDRAIHYANLYENSPMPFPDDYSKADLVSKAKKVKISAISTEISAPTYVASVSVPTKTDNSSSDSKKSDIVCYNCNEKGHFAKGCPSPKRARSRSPYSGNNQNKRNRYNGNRSPSPGNKFQNKDNNKQSDGQKQGQDKETRYCCHCDMKNHATKDCVWLANNMPCPTCEKCGTKGHKAYKCKASESN